MIPTARLATLLHDVGHLPASHLSERYYSDAECLDADILGEIERVKTDVSKTLTVPRPALGEVLSLAIILTPSMWRLLTEVAGYQPEQVAAAALAIVGAPPSPELAFLPNVITNVIDADKLDYLFRDALVTRIPLAVDLERLLYKLKVVEVDAAKVGDVLQQMSLPGGRCNVLATDLTGFDLLLRPHRVPSDALRSHLPSPQDPRPRRGSPSTCSLRSTNTPFSCYATPTTSSTLRFRRHRSGQKTASASCWNVTCHDEPLRSRTHSYWNRQWRRVGQSPTLSDVDQDSLESLRVDTLGDRSARDALLARIVEQRDRLASLLLLNGPHPELWLDDGPGITTRAIPTSSCSCQMERWNARIATPRRRPRSPGVRSVLPTSMPPALVRTSSSPTSQPR